MRLALPLAAEIAAARAVATLSRVAGAGGGTTVPGKLLSKLDPGAIDRLAARLPAGAVVLSATNGKTTTAAMAAEILRPRFRLAHNRAGANLVSGVASTLLAEGAEIRAYDPVSGERASDWVSDLDVAADPYEACADADVVVVLTEWDEFRWLDFDRVGELMRDRRIVDARNLLDPAAMRKRGFAYEGLGR